MAIDWGAWEGASPNRLRIGIEVDWETITHGETAATADIFIHLDAEGTWADTQTITFGGSISGSVTFSNNQSNNSVLRATKSYTYNYTSSQYGTSPGSRTFTASLSGAFNGATPSNSVTSNIPARPYGAPAAPTGGEVQRVSDTSQKITWNNNETAGEPWDTVRVQEDVNDDNTWATVGTPGGGSTSYTDSTTAANQKRRYRVRAENTIGDSAYDETSLILTTPSVPTSCVRTGPDAGAGDQLVSWSNNSPGYTEYNTEVWRAQDGVWALLTTVGSGVTSYNHVAPDPTKQWKYKVRHKTTAGIQGTLYSAYSGETTETAGQTSPPNAPTGLNPNGINIDPTLQQNLNWTYNPTDGSTQTKFFVRHRLAGAAEWTTTAEQTSSSWQYALAANTYADGDVVEWQVQTKGSDPVYSPWSESATFTGVVTPIAPDPVKIPVVMDLDTGDLEASTTAYELRNYIMRTQSQLMGGGIRTVSASYGISWSQRFITLGLGRSTSTFPNGHHDILSPYGWAHSLKEITSNVAKLTFTVGSNRARVGDTITVTGVGAPFDGQWVVRESGTNYVKFDLVNANIASTAATGATFLTIKGHGGASDSYANGSVITLNSWEALWYEMPFGWGAGTTPKKNGVVTVTNKVLTSNVATLTVVKPHYFAIGDRITVAIGDSVFDGNDLTITAMAGDTISYAKTNANVASQAASGYAKPSGKDTFFSHFHKTSYTADFVVPDNWVLLALRNGDASTVEWGTGDTVDPGFDSDSPVFKQVILNSVSDAGITAGNKPPLRIGNINGSHCRMDANEIQGMADDDSAGGFFINLGGGAVTLGGNGLGQTITLRDLVELPNINTTTSAANCNINTASNNRVRLVTSLSRFKLKQQKITLAAARGLLKLTPKTWFDKEEVDENGGSTEGLRRIPGLVAEDVEEHSPEWALYDGDGNVQGVAYDRVAAGLLVIVQDQERRLAELEAKLKEKR